MPWLQSAGAGWVAVHDAARPFFSTGLFRRVLEAARACGAAVPGLSPADTIKQVERFQSHKLRGELPEETRVKATLDRKTLVAVQTPQVFRKDLLVSAHRRAFDEGFSGTDDSQLVERLGVKVAVVPVNQNIKLTYPRDFLRPRAIRRGGSLAAGRTGAGDGNRIGFDAHPFRKAVRVSRRVTIPTPEAYLGILTQMS